MNNTTKRRKRTRWNTESFKKKVFELVGDEYTFYGEYINNRTKMKVIHNKCGYEYRTTPGNFLSGTRCRNCQYKNKSKQYTKTHEQFLKDLYKVRGDEYEPLQKYKGVHHRIDFKHKKCGKIWKTTPQIILSGSKCKKCYRKVYNDESFREKLKVTTNGEFEPLEKYIDSKTKIKFIHKRCGKEFESAPHNLLNFRKCPHCDQKKPRQNKDQFMKEFKCLVGNDYDILDKFRVKTDVYTFTHNRCGRTFEMTGSAILRGRKCPHCKMSGGEEKIARYLENNGYSYKREFRIDECRNKAPLPFDFAVFLNNELMCLIEFEGEQHYRSIKTWGGDEGLRKRKRNDRIKRNYCQINNIPLIEIPYWDEDNIDLILDKEFKEIAHKNNIKYQQLALF